MNYILKDNLISALRIVIETQELTEKNMGYTSESALLAGWKNNLKILNEGYQLEVL